MGKEDGSYKFYKEHFEMEESSKGSEFVTVEKKLKDFIKLKDIQIDKFKKQRTIIEYDESLENFVFTRIPLVEVQLGEIPKREMKTIGKVTHENDYETFN